MSEQAVKIVSEFSKLPETEEKKRISDLYMADEITRFDFFLMAKAYLEKIKGGKQ